MEQQKDHPIVVRPFEYSIVSLHFERDLEDWRDSYFDLTLRKGKTTRRLRFLAPSNIHISDIGNNGGMFILDISSRGWEDKNIEVVNLEMGEGSIELYARDVIDLDAPEITS